MKSFVLQKESRFIIGWVVLTSVGFVLGEVFLSPPAFRFVPTSLLESKFDLFGIMLGVASGIVTGCAIGFFQWLTLRNYITRSWLWMIATSSGMASGVFIERLGFVMIRYYLATYIATEAWAIINWISIFVDGLTIGLIQWVVLRKLSSKAWTWVIANGFGWVIATTIGDDVIRPILYPCCFDYLISPISEIVIYGVVGILFGIITGVLLPRLLKQNNLMVKKAT
jgi:hypothetical protein